MSTSLSQEHIEILSRTFDPQLVRDINEFLADADSVDVDAFYLSQRFHISSGVADDVGTALVALGLLRQHVRKTCTSCQRLLPEDPVTECVCCHAPIEDWQSLPESPTYFERTVARSRDVGWFVAVHGMATTGQWQQELQWLIDLSYKQSVPFANWKYGRVQIQPLVGVLQRRLVNRFASRLRALAQNQATDQLGDRPDVIAHSFGTWLVGHALNANADLRVGRVILLGAILRPDFDWQPLIERGQVDSVLNHYGKRDHWSRLAVRAIPDAGPSGMIGFLTGHPRVYNIATDGGHSSFFEETTLQRTFRTIWQPFLRDRLADLHDVDVDSTCGTWRPPPALLRAPWLVWLLLGSIAVLAVLLSSRA